MSDNSQQSSNKVGNKSVYLASEEVSKFFLLQLIENRILERIVNEVAHFYRIHAANIFDATMNVLIVLIEETIGS